MHPPTGRRAPGTKKARWTSAKKAAARKAESAQERADKGKPKRFRDRADGPVNERPKKDRWVDGRPARPESADRGRPRRSGEEAASWSGRRESSPTSYADRPARRGPARGGPTGGEGEATRPYARRSFRGDADDRSVREGERPTRGGDRPTRNADRPARGGDGPMPRGDRPLRGGDRPVRGADRSGGGGDFRGGDRPMRGGDRPFRGSDFRGSDRPMRGGDFRGSDRPMRGGDFRGGDRPMRGGERPFRGGDRPMRGGDRPAEARGIRASRERTEPASAGSWRPAEEPRPAPARPPADGPTFADLGLPTIMTTTLAQQGIHHPFPIQQATIPDALAGRDVLGRGRTGSGKTLGFGLPMLARLSGDTARPDRPRALVLVPTRELALQVADALEPVSRALGLRQKVVAGGMPYPPQLAALERGVDVVVATPGRLQDLIDRGAAILDAVEIVVLDEADHMADLGFLPEVTAIMDLVPEGGQRLLFSATLDRGIDELAERYLADPVTHSTDEATAAVTTMDHTVLVIEPSMKKTLTARITGRPGKTLVFVRTQLGADRVAQQLREAGILAGALHGGLTQAVRSRVLEAFKDGRLDVLVATDVAARGIHVDDISLVVQVDPPADHKTYVHRAGRTARAGSGGSVITLALPHQRRAMERIIDEVALSIRPERVDAAGERSAGPEPSGMPIPDEVWQAIVAPRPSRAARGPRRSFRPRPDSGPRPRRRF